jgi:hypothetical protein
MCTIKFSWSRKHFQQILTLQCIPEFASGFQNLGPLQTNITVNAHKSGLPSACHTVPTRILCNSPSAHPLLPSHLQTFCSATKTRSGRHLSLSLSLSSVNNLDCSTNLRSRSQTVYNRHCAVRQRLPSQMPASHNHAIRCKPLEFETPCSIDMQTHCNQLIFELRSFRKITTYIPIESFRPFEEDSSDELELYH